MSTKSYSGSESEAENEEIDWVEFIINNKYIVLNKIGKGSYCTVWAAYNMELKKIFALKIYNEEDTEDAQNEIQVLNKIKKLNLSNVILYNDSFNYEYGDDTYIMQVIDLCGYSLNYIIKLFKETFIYDSVLYEKYINFVYESYFKLNILLNNLHKNGYCHTDIKPENILIDIPVIENHIYLDRIKKIHNDLISNKKNKNINKTLQIECKKLINSFQITDSDVKNYLKEFNYSIKLSDFGTALIVGDNTIYKKHTQYYKSPKILLKYPLDYTYDYWSMACTLYELMTMDILFDPYDSELEDKYGDNDDRNLMYLITSTLGIPDKNILLNSKESDIYFDSSYTVSRGYIDINFNNFIEKLLNNFNKLNDNVIKNKYYELINFIVNHLSYEYLYKL
jgi:serine/threonine-protein kinase SRPK3